MPQKKVSSQSNNKRKRTNVTICIDDKLYEQLEELRTTKVGHSEIVGDRSSVYERMLILGLQERCLQNRKNELLEKLDLTVLESLDLDNVDLSKINPALLKRQATS